MIGPFAHPGNWLASLAYLTPLPFLLGVLGRGPRNSEASDTDR